MHFNTPTLVTIALTTIAVMFSVPVLRQGFRRRGHGVKYEYQFVIQRAPQLMSLLNIGLIVISFLVYNGLLPSQLLPFFALTAGPPEGWLAFCSWLGVALLCSGYVFMIGGWYSLGEAFSTDAEILDGQTVRSTGLLSFVMHPAYSGIIQSLLGASIAATSPISVLFVLLVVAPLWLKRAKYEEKLLIDTLGQSYKDYAEQMRWRRLVPRIFPIGV